ncbi:MAG: hypothetical protein KDA72_09250 [Planctomycetales bacterium]|nr:hypothetical protein [Planctomycetales bacterium]
MAQHFAAPLEDFEKRGWLKVDDCGVNLTRDGLVRVDRLIPSFYLPEHQENTYW